MRIFEIDSKQVIGVTMLNVGDVVNIVNWTSSCFCNTNLDLNPHKRNNMKASPIIIKDDVLIGAHATILTGVTIGEGSIVAAERS